MNKTKLNQNSDKDFPEWAIGPFVKHEKNPLLRPSKVGWDRGAVWNPTVIVENDRFWMLYRGAVAVSGGEDQIGLAWSDDGINWKKYENNPVLVTTKARETYEDPHLVRYKGTYYLHYNTWYWSSNRTRASGGETLASSKDLKQWKRHGLLFPDLSEDKKIPRNGSIVQNPCNEAVKINGRYIMYMNEHIAYSEDLLNWEIKLLKGKPCHEWAPGHQLETCIAITDYMASNNYILVFLAGGIGEHRYAITEAVYSKKNPEELLEVLEYPVLNARESYEMEGDYRDVLFMNSLTMHKGKWWLYYGASEKFIALATAPTGQKGKNGK